MRRRLESRNIDALLAPDMQRFKNMTHFAAFFIASLLMA
jgi:hypothetical protein